jgi:glycine dehydrogenase subunit 1
MTLAAAVYLSTLGKCGLRKIAELNYHKAHYAASKINALEGYSVNSDKPFFNEFVVKCPKPVKDVNLYLLEEWGIIGGYDLGRDYPNMSNHMLVAVTEVNTINEIDDLAAALKEMTQ